MEKNLLIPPGARIIDARDKYVLPGAIDCYTNPLREGAKKKYQVT